MGNSFMQSSTLKHLLVLISSIGLRLFKGFEEDVQDGAHWPSLTFCLFFFSIRVFFQGHWQIKREGTVFYSTLPLPSAHEHSDIYLQLCTWDDYRIFLIATLVFTRRDLPPYRITIWLIDDVMLIFVCLLVDLISGVKPVIILQPFCGKLIILRSVLARKKLKLPRVSVAIRSTTKPLPVKCNDQCNTKPTTSKSELHSSQTESKPEWRNS